MFRGVFCKKKVVDGREIEEIVYRPNWAASIFFRDTLGHVGRSHLPLFTYQEILEWAREQAKHDKKYERIFKAKRFVSLKKRETTTRSFCTRKKLRKCFVCSVIIEKTDGTSFVVPSRIHLDSWEASQRNKVVNNEKTDLFLFPPCPVDVFKEIGGNVSIEGFCSVSLPDSFVGHRDEKDYVRLSDKKIAAVESQPKLPFDPLEPRPWLSWSDCHVLDCRAPVSDRRRFENCRFSEMTNNGDTHIWLDCFDEMMAGRWPHI